MGGTKEKVHNVICQSEEFILTNMSDLYGFYDDRIWLSNVFL